MQQRRNNPRYGENKCLVCQNSHLQRHVDTLDTFLWCEEYDLLPDFALFTALGLICLALLRSSRTAFTASAMSCRPCRVNGMQVSI